MSNLFKGQSFGSRRKVLLLSAHTDDCEIGCGATIARLAESGARFRWLTFSNAWQSLPPMYEGDKDILPKEQIKAAKALGLPEDAIEMFDIPVRNFPEHRQEILDTLVRVGNEFQPDMVFCPSLQDRHQDHLTLAQEAQRAFKNATVLGYILPWNVTQEIRTVHVEVGLEHIEAKLTSIRSYDSQMHRNYFKSETFEMLMRANGIQTGLDNAEAFELIKWVERL